MKIVGVSRLCNEFVEEVEMTIGYLSAFCDEVCFLMHNVTSPEVIAAVHHCKNLVGVEQIGDTAPNPYKSKFNHYDWIDRSYHLANKFNPDWVVMQDQDEILPYLQLREGLESADSNGCDTLVLPVINCWGSPDRIVWQRLNVTKPHARVYKGGDDNFTITDGRGFSFPKEPFNRYDILYPYRHMGYMTESCRKRRLSIDPRPIDRSMEEPWCKTTPPVFPFRADWNINRWLALEEKDMVYADVVV